MAVLSTPAGHHTIKASYVQDRKRLRNESLTARQPRRRKKRRQGQALLRTRREEALCKAEGLTYETGGF